LFRPPPTPPPKPKKSSDRPLDQGYY